MYSAEGDTVLDPFAGMGTTNLACMASKRNSIGVEIDHTIAELALKNMATTPREINEVVKSRLANHIAFIESLPAEARQKCYDNDAHGFKVKTRQETAIKIDRITTITGDRNTVICTYQ